jgi:HSP20 family protein
MTRLANMGDLRRGMDRWVDTMWGGIDGMTQAFPALNVWEDGDSFFAEAELPGFTMADLEVLVVGDELSIKGNRQHEGEEVKFHRRERGTGTFARTITLPAAVNPDKVEAVLKNGVLMVMLPKAEEARARKITVKSA